MRAVNKPKTIFCDVLRGNSRYLFEVKGTGVGHHGHIKQNERLLCDHECRNIDSTALTPIQQRFVSSNMPTTSDFGTFHLEGVPRNPLKHNTTVPSRRAK